MRSSSLARRNGTRLHSTMIVEVRYVKPYEKVCKVYARILESARLEEKSSPIELVAFANDKTTYEKLASLKRGEQILVTGKNNITTFQGQKKEQLIVQEIKSLTKEKDDLLKKIESF